MITEEQWNDRKKALLHAWAILSATNTIQHFPMVAFVERAKAARPLAAKLWMEVTDPKSIEYAKATWKPHPSQEVMSTCDPNDPSRVNVICVVMPQV